MRFLAALVLLFPSLTLGQTYTISTLAGGGLPVNIPGTSASFPAVNSVAADAAGNVFMTLDVNHIVVRLDATTGMLTLVAGTGTAGFSGDGGPATSAQLSFPSGVAVDGAGNVYVLDKGNNRVREVSNGVITTVAGNGTRIPWRQRSGHQRPNIAAGNRRGFRRQSLYRRCQRARSRSYERGHNHCSGNDAGF